MYGSPYPSGGAYVYAAEYGIQIQPYCAV